MKINEKNLCVFAATPPFDISGFLRKRGEVNKAFQRRYFVLKGNLLFYFEKQGDKEPLGLIIVEGCTIELSEEIDNYCFEIAFNGNRTYVLAADTQDSMEAWMKALTCAGYEYKRIILVELQRQLAEIEDARNNMRAERSATSLQTNAKPNPPPRRQNPFNRTAPPIPVAAASNGLQQGVVVTPMPFIIEHFGASSERQLASTRLDNGNGSAHNTPKAPRRAAGGRSEFFVDPARAEVNKPTVLTPNLNNNGESAALQRQRRERAIKEFEQSHERFGRDVMRDINEYRAGKQPLVQI